MPPRGGAPVRGATLSLVALALVFATAAPAAKAVSFGAASSAALKATKSERRGAPAILFGLRAPLRGGLAIKQDGVKNRPAAGAGRRTLPVVLRVRGGSAYFFYLDLRPYQRYQHSGRVILVNRRTGQVRRSRRLSFRPVIGGKLAPFLRSRRAYELAAYRISRSDYAVAGATRAVRNDPPAHDAFGFGTRAQLRSVASQATLARALAEEKSCTVSVSSSLTKIDGALASLGSSAGASVLPLFVYSALSGRSLQSFVSSDVIADAGCKDVLVAISGDANRSAAQPAVRTGLSLTATGVREFHVTASLLREIIAANPSTTFKFMIDAPGSGAFIAALKSLSNVLVVATSSKPGQPAFRYLPRKRVGGRLVTNPVRRRADSSFFTTQLLAATGFAGSDAEVAHAIAAVAAGRTPSVLAWMIARSFALGAPFDFSADLGATPQLYTRFTPSAPTPGAGGGPGNGAPTANAQSVTATEDTATPITLSGTDPDANPLTFAIVGNPAHGTLSGSAPNVTYTPAANYDGPDAFAFTVSDGSLTSAPATVSLAVGASDDPPLAVDDRATLLEDAGSTAVAVLANDTDVDAGPRSIVSVTQPADGAVAITGGGTGLTYAPGSNVCNSPPGTSPDTFAYTLGGGSTATVSMTVTCVDDPPVTSASGTLAYDENDPASAIAPLLTVTDIDSSNLTGATVQITGNYQDGEDLLALPSQPAIAASFDAATGTLTLSGSASGADYRIALRAVTYVNSSDDPDAGDRTVTLRARDASGFGPGGTRTITVTAVNDRPAITTSAGPFGYTENDPATPIDPALVLRDPDSPIVSATVRLTDNYAGAEDILELAGSHPNITATASAGTDTLTLTGPASVAAFESALRSVTYRNSSSNPSAAQRTVTFVANDPLSASTPRTRPINVSASDNAPDVANSTGSLAYTENQAATAIDMAITISDPDSPNLIGATAQITGAYVNGEDILALPAQPLVTSSFDLASGRLTLSGIASVADYETALEAVTYANTSDDPSMAPRTVTYAARDAGGFGLSGTHAITITAVDDPPVAVADGATVPEDASPTAVSVLANDTDLDGGAMSIGSVTQPAGGAVAITGGGTGLTYAPGSNVCTSGPAGSPDTFTYTLDGGSTATVSMTVTCVDDPPVAVDDGATVLEDSAAAAVSVLANDTDLDGGAMSIGSVTQPAGGAVAITGGGTGLTYAPGSNVCTSGPAGSPDTFTYTLDGGSTATVSMTVTCVDDPPVAVDDSATVLEDASPTAVTVLANDTDVDGGAMSIAAVTQPGHGAVGITGGGTGLTYAPSLNYCNNQPGPSPDTFTYTLNGGSLATVSMTVTCVNDVPAVVNDTLDAAKAAVGNTTLVIDAPGDGPPAASGPKKSTTANILANDSDPDGPNALAVLPGTFASDDGGSVTIESDGDFVFTPAAGTSCSDVSDFFNYTVTDGDAGTPGTAAGRVNVAMTGCVWYVSNSAAGNAGTSTAPFDTLAQAQTASGNADTLFVYDGNDTSGGYDAGIDLKPNQRLLGEAATLQVGADVLQGAEATKRPTIADSNADVVSLASGNTVRGIQIDPANNGGGIAGGAGDTGGTIDDVRIIDSGTGGTQPDLELDGTAGTFDVSSLTIDDAGSGADSIGVRLNNNSGTVNFQSAGTISITTNGARGLDAAGTNMGAGSVLDAIAVTNSVSGAVSMVNTNGTTSLGDGSGSDLGLQTIAGATAALLLTNAGNVTVPGSGTANVSATSGPAIDVTGTAGASLSFDAVDSTSSPNDAINLDGLGSGTFSATSGTLAGAAGIAFDLNGGSGSVSYSGAITNGTGQSAEITNRTGAGVTLSGSITDNNDAGGGIALSGNSGGSTTFSNASKVIDTSAGGDAVLMSSSDGHTLTFSGGGLDIDATTGRGLEASNSGTLVISGSGNSIVTSTGTALRVSNTDFGGAGATFERIAAGTAAAGPASAIVLNGTGVNGGLSVTGSGGACTVAVQTCSGGRIQRTTSDAVSLTNTASPSLSLMHVHDAAGNGVLASNVSALTLANGIFVNNSDDVATNNEANLRMHNMSGTSSVTGSVFREARSNNVYWTPTAGAMVMNWTASTVGPAAPGELGAGLLLNSTGTANVTLHVSGGAFTGNNGDSLRPAAGGSSALNVSVSGATAFADSNSGVNVSADQDADVTFDVRGSTFLRHASHALQMIVNDNASAGSIVRGTLANNIIGDATPDSGSHDANGISYQLGGSADVRLEVTGNSVRNTDTQGIFIQSVRFPTGTAALGPNVDLTLRNNSVSDIDDNSPFPFGFQHGTQIEARRNSSMCLDIAGNSSTGIGGAQRFRVRQRDAATFRLERLTGSGADDANVANFIAAQNVAASSASTTHSTTFTPVPDGTCQAP